MKIGIAIINLGPKGGADKRYFNIIKRLKKNYQVYLLLNRSEFEYSKKLGYKLEDIPTEIIIKDNPAFSYNNTRNIGKKNVKIHNHFIYILKNFIPKKLRGFLFELYDILKYNYIVLMWAKKNKLDVLNSLHKAGIYTIAQVFNKTKVVFSYFDYEVFNGYPFNWIRNMGLKSVFKFCNQYDFLSEMIPQTIESKGLKLDKRKINIAPCSFIDLERISIGEKDRKRIVFSGRMEYIKNPILALEAIELLTKKKIDFELYLLGKGSLDTEIKEFIKNNDLHNKVRFYYEPNLERVLASASIYLSLQENNNYPSQALLEAMASECAIIATNVGETFKLIDDQIGFLVERNPFDIAEKLEILIVNHKLTHKLGKNARERVLKQYTIQNYEEYLLSVYHKAINK